MKRVNFKSITIKNFLSVGEEEIHIDFQQGFNLITGFNRDESDIRNGVGKSLVLDALYYAIFGETLREISKSFIVNRQIGRNCYVRLEFDQVSSKFNNETFVIERGISPNLLTITCNGEDKTKSSIPETNKYIKDVLSANEDVFQNCIIMRTNNAIPFMLKRKGEKKNFIESIFNLSIFSDMLKDVREDLKNAKHDYDICNTELYNINENKAKYESEIAKLQAEADKKTREAQSIINGLNNEILKFNNDIEELENKKKDSSEVHDKLANAQEAKKKTDTYLHKILQEKYKLDADIKKLQKELTAANKHGMVCPTCKREYDKEHIANVEAIKSNLAKEIETNKESLNGVLASEKKLSVIVEQVNNQISAFNQQINQLKMLDYEIKSAKEAISYRRKQIDVLNEKVDDSVIQSFVDMRDKAIVEIEEKEKDVVAKQKEISKYNVCEHILGEHGIKAYIINKLGELLNNRIAFYLEKFKSTFNFRFNDVFEEELKDINGQICSYGNCSGAESKKIDLAISFAFIDVLKYHQQIEYNLMFFDEILDSSLDTKSLENVINFISDYTLQNQKAVYLITHKSDVNMSEVNDTITLVKENGFTTRSL